MANDDPARTDRRGCGMIAVGLLLLLAFIGWLATQPTDSRRTNEVLADEAV